ncbi:hypothetical protein [Ferrimonas balearica]|uniref:hypothetical protein n=1 Tax=Ferrimonas balearica TaxID=44012 RepID=UPI001C99CD70|nr:hypothetical protein [Ferrimonas balearica]MBY5921268.1 hypothetical protein [Ferrimonas balearica]MBY5996047.1 hypothetical protein [Ferrimonas balearica]
MILKSLKKIGPALWLGFLVTGCASSVPQVSASRPLVSSGAAAVIGQALPAELSDQLSRTYSGQSILYKHYQILLGRDYVSALGDTCRAVNVVDTELNEAPQARIVCESQQQWWLMPEISDQTDSEAFFEASN